MNALHSLRRGVDSHHDALPAFPAFPQVLPLPQEAPSDTTDAIQEAGDSLQAAPDSSDVFSNLSREVGEAGKQLIAGDFAELTQTFERAMVTIVVDFVPKLITALFVFLVFYLLFRVVYGLLQRILKRHTADVGLQGLLLKSFKVLANTLILLLVLAQFDINVTALLAGFSIIGIAVGFAAKDTLENFIAGVTILLDRPFRVGDQIEVETTFGMVREITLRSTRLTTLNQEIVVMPNSHMINQKLINHTINGLLRIRVPFGIAYDEYPQQAREVAIACTKGDTRLDPNRPPQVVVTAMAASSIDMELRMFLKNPLDEIPIRFEYIERVREALREAKIEIPFPHLQLHIDGAQALESSFLLDKPPAFYGGPSSGKAPESQDNAE